MALNGSIGTGLQSEINITPLVDVVLVLLIIFMVVVPLMLEGYDVDTPRTSTDPAPVQAETSQVVLRIAPASCGILEPPAGEGLPADCRVSLDDHEIPAAQLPAQLSEKLGRRPLDQRVLFLAADDRLNYEGVLRIVDLAKSGVDGLTIGVITAD
ncbi:MAG TPA: biopolymer transporter ExbD [Candidatus Polarisedimenticolaceae bacterium]|nr:biopolymer transporter ExbD [Candidatus Polarisedimenticolaceae bacterium]